MPVKTEADISLLLKQSPESFVLSMCVRGYRQHEGHDGELLQALRDRVERVCRERGASFYTVQDETYSESRDIHGFYGVALVDFHVQHQQSASRHAL